MKNDTFSRKTDGYLPKVEVAFLDEVFKANSSILNSLLTIINEKKYHNGKEEMEVPLISLIGASNEFPKQEELLALYDRFLIKREVDYISNEIKKVQKECLKIEIPEKISRIIIKVIQNYENHFKNKKDDNENELSEKISDRKIVKISKLLKVSAYTNGRKEVDISDLILLNDCLWNNPKNRKVVEDVIGNTVEKELMRIF